LLSFFICFYYFSKSLSRNKKKQDGPLPAAKFYGATPPAAALKSCKESATPTLKEAFSKSSTTQTLHQQIPQASKQKGKKCTAHFGCSNFAAFTEESGTLYCRDHKPKSIPVQSVKTSQTKVSTRKKTVELSF